MFQNTSFMWILIKASTDQPLQPFGFTHQHNHLDYQVQNWYNTMEQQEQELNRRNMNGSFQAPDLNKDCVSWRLDP